jgi:hypothetical protein
MNYEKIYNQIIENAKTLNRVKGKDMIFENHHILPKSIGGGNNKENLVLLTPKEHYICHRLLVQIYRGTNNQFKMYYAMWCMINGLGKNRHITSSKIYEKLRIEMSEIVSKKGPDNRKIIEQYSLDGKFIQIFNSVKDASINLELSCSAIESCARGEVKSSGGFNWKYRDSEKKIEPILHKKSGRKTGSIPWNKNRKFNLGCVKNTKKILQYSLNGDFIKEWDCISEASNELKINRGSIENCANDKSKSAGNFNWKYKNSQKIIKKIIYKKSGRKKISTSWKKNKLVI